MKALVKKDPLQDVLKFAREQEEREKHDELALVKLLMSQPAQVPMMFQPYRSPYKMSAPVQQWSNSAGARVQSKTVLDESLVSFKKQISHVYEIDDQLFFNPINKTKQEQNKKSILLRGHE